MIKLRVSIIIWMASFNCNRSFIGISTHKLVPFAFGNVWNFGNWLTMAKQQCVGTSSETNKHFSHRWTKFIWWCPRKKKHQYQRVVRNPSSETHVKIIEKRSYFLAMKSNWKMAFSATFCFSFIRYFLEILLRHKDTFDQIL